MNEASGLDTEDWVPRLDAAVRAFRQGQPVLLIDMVNPDRGGVIAVAARHCGDDVVNFMATHGRGLSVIALTAERVDQLGLSLQGGMVGIERENYTVSIEAREGVSTGISAADRARTIQVVADRRTRSDDLVSPGHVFPVVADDGGVVSRRGWAEATTDLARLAGMDRAAAFTQVLDLEGELADRDSLAQIAHTHGLPEIMISDIVAYRMAHESFVNQVTQSMVSTEHGDFLARVFINELDGKEHLALSMGSIRSNEPVLVRLHSECLTGDVFTSQRCDCGDQLAESMRRIAADGRGVVLYLRQEGRGIGLVNKMRAYALQDEGRDTVEANHELGFAADSRDFGVGAQMLLALGVRKVRLLTNNPSKVLGLTRYGITVVNRESLEMEPGEYTRGYLVTKKQKLGHLLDKV